MPLPLRGIHRASATLCGMPPPFRSGHSLLVFPLLILQTQAVRSLGVAQMLLRAGSMVRGRRYNCDVVLCEAALFDGRNDWVSRLNISDGPPWVVIGDLPHCLHGVSNVFAVNTSMMQRRLRERLEMVFNPNSTPSRAPPDMADREHPHPTTAQPCNATPNNATPSMGMSVLSVDDVSMNQLIMGSFLKRLGAQVHLAENGRQACYLNPAPASYTPLLWSWREHPPPTENATITRRRNRHSDPNHLEERLLDQAQARASYTPLFWGRSRSISQCMVAKYMRSLNFWVGPKMDNPLGILCWDPMGSLRGC